MRQNEIAPFTPLSRNARFLVVALLAELIAIWAIGFYAYLNLPTMVATSFSANGLPAGYGSNDIFLLLSALLSIAPLIILIVVYMRFTLLNRYPFAVNLPAFYYNIARVPFKKRGVWVNRYYEAVLGMGAGIALIMLLLMINIYLGIQANNLSAISTVYVFIAIMAIIAGMIYYLYTLFKKLNQSLKGARKR